VAQEALATQALDGSGATLLPGVPSQVEPNIDNALLGTISVGAGRANPQPCDDTGSPRHELVVWGTDIGMPGHTTPGDTVLAPGSTGAVGPGVAGLLLPGYPVSPSPPINCGHVEDRAEQACSQVVVAKRLL
jgi:hypothetical protein